MLFNKYLLNIGLEDIKNSEELSDKEYSLALELNKRGFLPWSSAFNCGYKKFTIQREKKF